MQETFGNSLLQTAVVEDTFPGIHGMDTELLVWMLGVSLQNPSSPSSAASQGGSPSPSPAPCASPATSSGDELPATSSTALAEGASSHGSAPAATPMEQEEPQEEPGEAVPGLSTSSQGRHHSPGWL